MTEMLMEASTFVADAPALSRFATARVRQVQEKERNDASESGDYTAIAESYAAENSDLKAAIELQAQQIETLTENVEALNSALRSQRAAAVRPGPDEAPPETVAEAVDMAQRRVSAHVAFAENLDSGVETLNPTAGGPEKILRHLTALGEMAKTLEEFGSLGRSIPIWLRERGIECSIESENVKASRDATRRRTFPVNGNDSHCEFHTKPSDGVSPDLCVRIYFGIRTASPWVHIGYVGRHFD